MGKDFTHISYKIHSRHLEQFAEGEDNAEQGRTWFQKDNVDYWRHERMYRSLDPLLDLYPESRWLTVGDGRFGRDANYIKEKGFHAVASDITDVLLREGKSAGFIDHYSKENAEALSFNDNVFDFVFCKEAYHHFPRPMIALYEMLRVAKKGVILIEPNDSFIFSSFLEVLLRRFRNIVKTVILKKPAHGYEEVGNYVYSISEREIEKVALGMNLQTVAFKGINDFYTEGAEFAKAEKGNRIFRKIKFMILLHNLLCKLRLQKYRILTAVIFKERVSKKNIEYLKNNRYNVISLPDNPYL